MYEQIRIHFNDGTSTLHQVDEDDNIQDAVVELCEQEGWNTDDVIRIEILDT